MLENANPIATPTPLPVKSTMNPLFFVVAILIILALILGAAFYFKKNNLVSPSQVSLPKASQTAAAALTELLPIDPNSPAVKSAAFVYTVRGKITNLTTEKINNQNLLKIDTNIKGDKIPSSFYVDSKTKINFTSDGKTTTASSSALEKGQIVNISLKKDLKQKDYVTTSVTILLSSGTKVSTPAAASK